jgi:outer membrane lipoprotein carrier protein
MVLIFRCLFLLLVFLGGSVYAEDHNWNSPAEVVKKVKKKFTTISAYTSDFVITDEVGVKKKTTKVFTGKCLYKAPGKIKYEFSQPQGDVITSDGKTLWVYIKSINAVGKQDLTIEKTNKAGKPIFQTNSKSGLNRLFRKYHYKFNSTTQPQKMEDGKEYFVLALEQREKVGGFENMLLYIEADTYLIKKSVATDSRGKTTILEFRNMQLNPEIEDGIFNYHISGNSKIVNNPFVSDNQ